MKVLYLLRHAKSSWSDAGLDDQDRPLAPRGRAAAHSVAVRMRRLDRRPEIVLCSPSRRTRETLEPILKELTGAIDVRIEPGLYAADARRLLRRLRRIPEQTSSALVVGHNPGLQDLAVELLGPGRVPPEMIAKFPTAGLAVLRVLGAWADLSAGTAELVEFERPADLPG